MQRFVKNSFDEFREATIGAAFITKTVELDEGETIVKFEIWDSAGQERYKSLAPMYYRNANGAIVVFDVTDEFSFERAKSWIDELELQAPNDLIIKLIGNKSDLKNSSSANTIDEFKIQQYCDLKKIEYVETSAKTGENVDLIFKLIAEDLPAEKFKYLTDLENEANNGGSGNSGIIDLSNPGGLKSGINGCSC